MKELGKLTKKYNICVVGAGHVGLVAAACFAQLGHQVICADSDKKKLAGLRKGIMPFYEPDMESLVIKHYKKGTLEFCDSLAYATKKSEVIFLAVGTPPQKDGSADLSAIENVVCVIAQNLNAYKLIVEKSTVPVQTGQKVKEVIKRYKQSSVGFDVASNPEFLREGKAVNDFFYPDRLVIGVESKQAEEILKDIYSPLKANMVVTDINTAELIKHASNSFLATKISFINAVARICDITGADVEKVAQGMGMDKRIGRQFLNAGLGYGGFCFPKDVEAFVYIAQKIGYDFSLLKAVKDINADQWHYYLEKVKEHLWILKNKKIAVLGLAFKPDTDDMRFAPAINIIESLLKQGARVSVYDPEAMPQAKKILKNKNLTFAKDPYEAIRASDCLCLVTEWQEFNSLDLAKIKKIMKYAFIADGRNMFDKEKVLSAGFKYICMGR